MKNNWIRLALAVIAVPLLCSCGQSTDDIEAQLDGTLNYEQIIEHANSGRFLGLTLDELTHLCGTNEQENPAAEYAYQKCLGTGCPEYDSYFGISLTFLLAKTAEGRVIETKIVCD